MDSKREAVNRLPLRLGAVPALVLLLAIVLSACGGSGLKVDVPRQAQKTSPSAAAVLPSPNPESSNAVGSFPTVQVVQKVAPAVVNVTTRVSDPSSLLGGDGGTGQAVGTGFVIRPDGVIVTNFHVVEGALNIKVTMPPPDSRSFGARVIGGDSDHDLAILKVDGSNLPIVPLGDSSTLKLGEPVVALGYALALPGGPTVTQGIISALTRTVQATDPNANNGAGVTRTYQDALQTDAAINPGNSGGPLVDYAGNVIGINTAGNTQAENIGFSIAIDAAKPIISQAIAHPSAPSAYLGVTTETVDAGVASQFGLGIDHGAVVLALTPKGPAARAGLRTGDVIVAFDGHPVNSSDDLGKAIMGRKPGAVVQVQVVHQDRSKQTFSVTLGVRPLPTP
jgi:S1-C subfamily serine protease